MGPYLALDCEFNSHQGDLISIALVNGNHEFYYEVHCPTPFHPWVQENVVPHLTDPYTEKTMDHLRRHLELFLRDVGPCTIIADWWADIEYLMQILQSGPGKSISTPNVLRFIVDRQLHTDDSKVPHHALHDARALWNQTLKKLFALGIAP